MAFGKQGPEVHTEARSATDARSTARRAASARGASQSSHPDQFFPIQIGFLRRPLPGHFFPGAE